MRKQIAQGIRAAKGLVDEVILDALDAKVRRLHPDAENLAGYAYQVGRNWAIDQARRDRYAVQSRAAELLKKELELADRARRIRCQCEFVGIWWTIGAEMERFHIRQLLMVQAVCFEGLDEGALLDRFPQTTAAQRWQWKHRGLKLVWPYASDELRAHLGRGTRAFRSKGRP